MDIMDELNNLQKQKQVQQNTCKLTYDEYKTAINHRLQRINGELFMLFHELAAGQTQSKINDIHNVITNFKMQQINDLYEQLKTVYY